MMTIRVGRRLVGKPMVDRRGCDGVEEFIYGGALVSMRVVNGPIHRCWGQQGLPGFGEQVGKTGDLEGGEKRWGEYILVAMREGARQGKGDADTLSLGFKQEWSPLLRRW